MKFDDDDNIHEQMDDAVVIVGIACFMSAIALVMWLIVR